MKNLASFACGMQLLLLVSFSDCLKELEWLIGSSSKCKADAQEKWTYRGSNGPKYWADTYPACNGKEQSPVALSSIGTTPDGNLAKLAMHGYDIPVSKATVQNNGHSVQVTPEDGVSRTIFVDGATYKLDHVHFHWGDAYYHGSEHTLDGVHYAMEAHFVHKSVDDQLAVVGVFFQEQSQTSPELQKIIDTFPHVTYKGDTTRLASSLSLGHLLPANPSSFYRYPGSLTTPGCDEGVTWSVLTKPLPVGLVQMEQFRKLYSARRSDASPSCKLSNNYRPLQPLNHRTVLLSQ